MQFVSSPVVSAQFVSIGSPLDSFGVTSWHKLAPLPPAAAPTISAATARAVPESVLEWRARYYAFRHARTRILAGNRAAADAILSGPHGDYVRERFAKLATADARFTLERVARTPAPLTPRAAKQSRRLPSRAPVPTPEAGPAPVVAPPLITATPAAAMTIDRDALRRGLWSVIKNAKAVKMQRHGKAMHIVRLVSDGVRLRVGPVQMIGKRLHAENAALIDVGDLIHGRAFDFATGGGKILLEIARLSAADASLSLEIDGGTLHVRGRDAHYKLLTLSPDIA